MDYTSAITSLYNIMEMNTPFRYKVGWLTVLQLPLICYDKYIIFDKLCQFTIYLQTLRYDFCLTILKI